MRPYSVLVVFLLAAAASAAPVTGRVVDKLGRPARNVQVATTWNWAGGRPSAHKPLVVAEDSTFSGDISFRGREQALIAYNEKGTLAGVAMVSEDDASDVTITLQRSVRVKARFVSSDLGGDAGWVNTYWYLGRSRPVSSTAKKGRIDIRLPAAENWESYIYGRDVKSKRTKHEIDGTKRTVDLGRMDLPATFIALNIGLPAEEWTVADSRGIAVDAAQIKDLEGKWVLVEFWGHW